MKNQSTLTRIRRFFPFILLLTVSTARFLPGLRTIDDAYITYRYARNILSGLGFTYNPGEFVQGTTTPLYTLLLAFVGLFSGGPNAPFPALALLINTVCDGITALILWNLGKKLDFPIAGAATALFWAIAPFSVTFAIGGLETSLYILGLSSSVYFYVQKKHRFAALTASLSILTRPDAILLVIPLILDRLRHLFIQGKQQTESQKSIPDELISETLIFILPLLAWFGFAWFYFGNPIPHSVLAKSQAYHLSPYGAFTRILQHFATPFMGHHTFGTSWIRVGLILFPFLCILGSRRVWKSFPRFWPLIVYPWVYFLTFSFANPLIFRWYLTPPLLPYVFFIFIGLQDLLTHLFDLPRSLRKENTTFSLTSLITLSILFAPLILPIRAWTLHPDHGPDRPAPKMAWFKLELVYEEAAEIIRDDAQVKELSNEGSAPVLAAADVGVLGYYTPLPILDIVGLNSRQSLEYYPVDFAVYDFNFTVPPNLILNENPAYVVILERYGRGYLLEHPSFQEEYRLLSTIKTNIYHSEGMLLFKRSDLY